MASRIKRSVPVTVNDVLDGHVALDLECLEIGRASCRERVLACV